jgi:DNA-binding MarR family transcriptional regulator
MKREIDVLVRELRRLAEATHDARAELLAQAGIDAHDRRVLGALAAGGGRTTTRRLALSLLSPGATIEASLSRLHSRGWVAVPAAQDDADPTHSLTTLGRQLLLGLQRDERRFDALFDDEVGSDDLRRAARLLRAARRRLVADQRRRLRPFVDARRSSAAAGALRSKLETRSSDALSATASAA